MRFFVEHTAIAAKQIRREARWWKHNRTKAPALFSDELRNVMRMIAEYPEVAPRVEGLTNVRRALLEKSQHYVYYFVNYAEHRIQVLAVWGTARGTKPPL